MFGYHVDDPERYGVVEFDEEFERRVHRGEAGAPQASNYAVTGLYFYDEPRHASWPSR
ncbi:MAG: sugar phosphate nucleotidyltransferase [Bifidobacterium pseudocatenulatum]